MNGLSIAFVGDLKNGRTVHSLARLLTNYADLHFYYVAPAQLRMPKELMQHIQQRGISQVTTQTHTHTYIRIRAHVSRRRN